MTDAADVKSVSEAVIRPSSLPGLAQCPGWRPDQSRNVEDKDAGTRRHVVLARVLTGDEDALYELPDEEREAIGWAARYVLGKAPTGVPIQAEQRVTFTGPDFESYRGTADVVAGQHVFDLKWRTTWMDHEAQVAAYVLGLPAGTPWPRFGHVLYAEPREIVVHEFTSVEHVQNLVHGIIERATSAAIHQLAAGPACSWCAEKLTCPAMREEVEAAEMSRDANTVDDPEVMGVMLERALVVLEWAKAVKERAKEMALAGRVPTGFRLATRMGRRHIRDVANAFPLVGLPQDVFLRACEASLEKLADAYSEFAKIPKATARRLLEGKLEPVIERGNPSRLLVRQ